jgi:hypothetical protein
MFTKQELYIIWYALAHLRSPSSEEARIRVKVRALYDAHQA